jgi:hypothetical protein
MNIWQVPANSGGLLETAKSPVYFKQGCPRNVRVMEAPRQLSRQAVDEFKAIYRDEFGEDISNDEALEMALRLLRLFDLLLQPLPGDVPSEISLQKSPC